jgi:hypothetical protein
MHVISVNHRFTDSPVALASGFVGASKQNNVALTSSTLPHCRIKTPLQCRHSNTVKAIDVQANNKMSGRTSARSAANRQRALSPPEEYGNPRPQSPVRRRTRSQSVELGNDDTTGGTKRGGGRNIRQASVESESDTSNVGRVRKGRTKKAIRTPAINPGMNSPQIN